MNITGYRRVLALVAGVLLVILGLFGLAVHAAHGAEVITEGRVRRMHADLLVGGADYWEEIGNLTMRGLPKTIRTDDVVRVRGAVVSTHTIRPVEVRRTLAAVAQAADTMGPQRTLVMMVHFENATNPFTPAQVQAAVFTDATSTANFFHRSSYQQTTLVGDVVGPYRITGMTAPCDYWNWMNRAIAAANAAGVPVNTYRRLLLIHPNSACSWGGLSTVGGNPSYSWANGTISKGLISHELGHGFGLYHSHALDCGDLSTCSGGTAIEYGGLDTMGQSSFHRQFSAPQKAVLGWLTPLSAGAGRHDLEPFEGLTGQRALKVAASSQYVYFVEYRTEGPQGVVVHLHRTSEGNDGFYLADMTPQTNWQDVTLGVGLTWQDTLTRFSLRTDAAGASATVTVGLGTTEPPIPPIPPPTGGTLADDFNRPNQAGLGAGWRIEGGAWGIVNQEAVVVTGTAMAHYLGLSGSVQSASAKFTRPSLNEGRFFGVIVRAASQSDYVVCYRRTGSADLWVIAQVKAGREKELIRVTAGAPVPVGVPFRIFCAINADNVVTVSDERGVKTATRATQAAATGRIGIRGDRPGMRVDEVMASSQ